MAPRTPRTPTRRSSSVKPASPKDLWFSPNPAKRWTEIFFLLQSVSWIVAVLLILVPFKLYESLDAWRYMGIGLFAALPCVIVPMFYESKADAAKRWNQKYWVKANVPITLYFMTHAYFCLYHALSNVLIRRSRHAAASYGPLAQIAAETVVVFALSYATAYGETLTIAHFPYYSFVDKAAMYRIGSLFYAIYFFVSFPMFYRMDEEGTGKKAYGLWRAVVDALAAGMLVTILLDFWRLGIGHIYTPPAAAVAQKKKGFLGLPWL